MRIKYLLIAILILLPIMALAAPSFTVENTLLPISDIGYDLGTSTRRWRNLYARNASTTALSVSGQTGCAQFDANGGLLGTPANCGSAGGNSKWATSTNSTDIQPNVGQGLNVNASSTFTSNVQFTGPLYASSTSLFSSGLMAYSSSTLQNTTTGILRSLGAFYASTTALFTDGFTAYSSSTLQNFTGVNATTTNATTTTLNVANNFSVSGSGTSTFVGDISLGSFLKLSGYSSLSQISGPDTDTGIGFDAPDIFSIHTGRTNRFYVTGTGNVGIADQSPLFLLTVGSGDLFGISSAGVVHASSTALFTNGFTAYASSTLQDFTARFATTSQATTTALYVSGIATTTFNRGIDLNGGCFAILGTCVGGASIAGQDGQIQYNNGGAFGGSTSFIFDDTLLTVGIGATTTPRAKLSVAGTAGGTTPLFLVSTSTAEFATTTVFSIGDNGDVIIAGKVSTTTGGMPAMAVLSNIRSYTSGATTWNKSARLAYIVVKAWGGGGGGGAAIGECGGSGAGYSEELLFASELGASETATVGAGGGVETNGNDSTFGSHLTAGGGGGSTTAVCASVGTASGGDINLSGFFGNVGVSGATVGAGGGSPFAGTAGHTGLFAANGGANSGQGGTSNSGSGGSGLILVYEYTY